MFIPQSAIKTILNKMFTIATIGIPNIIRNIGSISIDSINISTPFIFLLDLRSVMNGRTKYAESIHNINKHIQTVIKEIS